MTDNTINIGIIGFGRAGRDMHAVELEELKEKFRISAVCDPIDERRQEAYERYGAAVGRKN